MGCWRDINNKVKSHHKMTQEYVRHLGQGPCQRVSSGKCKRNPGPPGKERMRWWRKARGLKCFLQSRLSGGGSTAPRPCGLNWPQRAPEPGAHTAHRHPRIPRVRWGGQRGLRSESLHFCPVYSNSIINGKLPLRKAKFINRFSNIKVWFDICTLLDKYYLT